MTTSNQDGRDQQGNECALETSLVSAGSLDGEAVISRFVT